MSIDNSTLMLIQINFIFSVPPSYEEAVNEIRMEENFEEWDHTKEFAPKYPVYHFDKK